MRKIKIEIKNRWSGKVIFEYESETNTIKETVARAIDEQANLSDANLSDADLSDANLSGANLRGANLRHADLSDADLSTIRKDFFDVLLRAIPEVPFLKKNIIEGKIDGSTYEGKCACLSGTLFNGASLHNGAGEEMIKNRILDCRDSGRPIERFFLAIKTGDTPETNQFSKIALDWVNEFESYINPQP